MVDGDLIFYNLSDNRPSIKIWSIFTSLKKFAGNIGQQMIVFKRFNNNFEKHEKKDFMNGL